MRAASLTTVRFRRAMLTGVLVFLIPLIASARTEYVLRANGRIVKGEVCFFHAGPTTAPSDRWFYSNDVRCYPSSTLLDHPIARLHFFGRAPGLISNFGTILTNSEEQRPESYKRVPIDLVPSATFDARTIALGPGESLAILAAATSTTNGILLPLPDGTRETQVPAGLPLLALKIANRAISAVSLPFTLAAGTTGTASFPAAGTNTGIVVAWLKIPRELYAPAVMPEGVWGELRTHLECGTTRIAPVWDIRHSQIASGHLQIFTNVPAGRCTAVLDGDLWQPASTVITSVAGQVSTAPESLEAIPAGIITADYALPAGPVPLNARIATDCTTSLAAPALTIDLFHCAKQTDACRDATRTLTDNQPATFARLQPGTYWLRGTHPSLGATSGTASVSYNGRTHTTLTASAFPLFGRVTKGGKPVRAQLGFYQRGTPVFTTTDADGRYEVLLRDQPDATISVKLCDGGDELTHRATERPAANTAFDITLPDAHFVVTVEDAATGAKLADARITAAAAREKDTDEMLHVLRTTSNAEGAGEIVADPAWWWTVCASKTSSGYIDAACTDPLRLKDDETRVVTLRVQQTGTVKARILPLPHARGTRLYHVRAGTLLNTITIPPDGEVWLREEPAPGDYFTYTSPEAPLTVLTQWSRDEETLVLNRMATGGIALKVMAPETAHQGRLIGLQLGAYRIPSRALDRHPHARHQHDRAVAGEHADDPRHRTSRTAAHHPRPGAITARLSGGRGSFRDAALREYVSGCRCPQRARDLSLTTRTIDSKRRRDANSNGALLDGMKVHVVDAARRFAGQSRRIEVVDVADLRVEHVEHVEVEPHARRDLVSDTRIEEVRGIRAHAVVLDEGPRTEVAVAQLAGDAVKVDEGQPDRYDAFDRAGNAISTRIVVAKACAGEGVVGVDREPVAHVAVGRHLEAHATARPARLGAAGVAGEQELRRHVQRPQRRRQVNARDRRRAQPDLGTACAHEWRDAIGGLARGRIDADRDTARIVAVEAGAGVRVKLGVRPRPEDHRELRAEHRCAVATGVLRRVRIDVETVFVGSKACDRPQPRLPLN